MTADIVFTPGRITLANTDKLFEQTNKFKPLDECESRTTILKRLNTSMKALHFIFNMDSGEKFVYGLDFMLKHTEEGCKLLNLYEKAKEGLCFTIFCPSLCFIYIEEEEILLQEFQVLFNACDDKNKKLEAYSKLLNVYSRNDLKNHNICVGHRTAKKLNKNRDGPKNVPKDYGWVEKRGILVGKIIEFMKTQSHITSQVGSRRLLFLHSL
jgi:hypothetical protein